ncbi:MOSC domain-containing protein [Candidatus Woesearchaeota archaeon]|nr:MOSC domain-containing protein [Candidatus Woesearchaeota archaeon]
MAKDGKKGRILAVCISERKGAAKVPVDSVELREGWGLVGDAHAGSGHRQVSLLSIDSQRRAQEHPLVKNKVCVKDGSFGENLLVEGIVLHTLPVGTRLKAGPCLLEVTQIGKECQVPCEIGRSMGVCVMPSEGIFAIVLEGGTVRVGDPLTVL